jgi:glycosyltransferase involved in cell wall biosynthesis
MVDVTVIIPVFNRKSAILKALDSVASQTRLPKQLIVVDDGSTDGSAEAVARWIDQRADRLSEQSEGQIRLFRRPKQTAAAARQFGLSASEPTKYVAFLDSDDLWPIDFLQRGVAIMDAEKDVAAASADRRYLDASGKLCREDDCRGLAKHPIEWIFRHGGGIASCSLFRRDAIDAAGGWDARLPSGEDAVLFSTVATLGSWRHLAGEPVTFRHSGAAGNNEEINLSRKHVNSFQRWAICYERIYESLANRYQESDRRRLRRYVAAYWYRAGKQLQSAGQHDNALACYDHAIRWHPLMLRSRLRRRRLRSVQPAVF